MGFSPKFMVLLMAFVTLMIVARSSADTSPGEVEGVEGGCGGRQACCREVAHGVCVDSGCCQVQGVRKCCRIPGTTIYTPYGQKWRNFCCQPRAKCAANARKCIMPSSEGGLRAWAREVFTGETEATPDWIDAEDNIEEVV